MHLAFSKRTFDAHSSDWAQAHCLKDLNTLAEVQVAGEGMPLASMGYKKRVVGWLFFGLFVGPFFFHGFGWFLFCFFFCVLAFSHVGYSL